MAKRELSPLPRLAGEQARAAAPDGQIRLSASAGAGKTQVLTARVLRLLLHGVKPESILCLTFTKAGAAEMADRIHERLGAWVTMKGGDLARDLNNLGEEIGPEEQDKARSLFASVLDARGSGLRIQTIHSFCQTLLAAFPSEANLAPGFRAIEGREEEQLAAAALADMVAGFAPGELDRFKATAKRLAEDAMRAFLRRCAAAPDAMEALGPGIAPKVRAWLGLFEADVDALVLAGVSDGGFDDTAMRRVRDDLRGWGTASAHTRLDAMGDWLRLTPDLRAEQIGVIHSVWAKQDGDIRSMGKGQAPQTDGYADSATGLYAHFAGLIGLHRLATLSESISDALQTGQAYARAYADAKRAAGAVDFNDLIRRTVALLKTPGIGDWIRFKLDQSVDHILVDEAQDTNADQWEIVKALAGEFFAGAGAKDGVRRTIFKVGDYKQAIFGFQGTDPREFEEAVKFFAQEAENAGQDYLPLTLNQSFRSSEPILAATDAVIAAIGFEAMGLPEAPEPHRSARGGSGRVTLLPPVRPVPDEEEAEQAEEGWIGDAELKWADELAQKVKHWTTGGLRLRNQKRDAEPGDVMILVRSRGELARLIVSRLYQEGVAVAGVDRLTLGAPIAVQDLLACIRFALQPEDDLSVSCLLVSPLVGWSQDALYQAAKGRTIPLWQHLGDAKPFELIEILNRADRTTPYRFLESILSDPQIQGRKRLIGRLGEEARDPIEELLNAALAFERQATPSLQLFLDWFDRGEVQIKRDPAKPENAVRVMTAHGAKGLQAPIVVLADACADPDFKHSRDLDWEPEHNLKIPLFRPKTADMSGSLLASAEAQDAREREEHWRLLYVAMTRAEEYLFAGGALKPKQLEKGMSDQCWHSRIGEALQAFGADADGEQLTLEKIEPEQGSGRPHDVIESWAADLPDWATSPAAPEARPPRPLAPSAILPLDTEASPPPDAALRKAARRGVLLHSLFERLPGVALAEREAAAQRWLEHSAGVADAIERAELTQSALATLSNPAFAHVFAPGALVEVPLAGVVEGQVIAGTVDRLLVGDSEVLVVDFKTGRRVPRSTEAVSAHHKAQMAAYVAVLAGAFPGRSVRAALLYSSGPELIELSPEILAAFKPGFIDAQQDLAVPG